MSFDLFVYMSRSQMPTPEAWQRAIADSGFPVLIDQEFDADTHTGYLPCQYNGVSSGFEYYSARLRPEEAKKLGVGSFDFEVTLRIHSDHHEMEMALSAASALCVASQGILVDPQSGETISPGQAIAWATESIRVCSEYAGDA